MQHQHPTKQHDTPDYEFHMPETFTHPIPVSIISGVLASLFYFQRDPTNRSYCVGRNQHSRRYDLCNSLHDIEANHQSGPAVDST